MVDSSGLNAAGHFMRRAPEQSPNPERSQKVEDKPILNTEKETVRLHREANYAEGLKRVQSLRKKTARDSTGKLAHPVREMDKSLRQEGRELILRRIRPNTVVGPFLDVIIFHVGNDSGIDVQIQSTVGKKTQTYGSTRAQTRYIIAESSMRKII